MPQAAVPPLHGMLYSNKKEHYTDTQDSVCISEVSYWERNSQRGGGDTDCDGCEGMGC